METEFSKRRISICHQGKRSQFYFQVDYDKEYFLYRIFTVKIEGGIYQGRSFDYINNDNPSYGLIAHQLMEVKGLYIDVTILNIRLGVYLHPIRFKYKEKKKK